jgi:hypothetical protein
MSTRKKILVVNSPLFATKNALYDEDSLPPIGLGLIATALKTYGHNVALVDCVALNIPLDDVNKLLQDFKPEFICTNIFTTNYELVKKLIETFKGVTNFIIGGLSTKELWVEITKWKTDNPIDVIHGDGELITPAIISDSITESPTYQISNRRFYSVYSTSKYFVTDISNDNLDRSFFVNEPIQHPFGFTEATIITSRAERFFLITSTSGVL